MRRSVLRVHAGLLAALGLPAVACGGQTFSIGAGDASVDGAVHPSNDGGVDASVDAAIDAPIGKLPFTCVNPTPILIDGKDTGFDACQGGVTRRRESITCVSKLPRGALPQCVPDPNGPTNPSGCLSDTQCTDKPNGACTQGGAFGGAPGCYCAYGCTKDAECGSGEICVCGDPIGTCEPASCATGADCATPGAECVDYTSSPGCPMRAFACESPVDKCLADSDCPSPNQCTAVNGGRVCQPPQCAVGRPFLVLGEARLPPLAVRADWIAGDSPIAENLAAITREHLSMEWARIGQMEHASIAAFARFVLQLLAVGAPPRLVEDAQRAMADETNHAKLAFGLATHYGKRAIGPGPLAIDTCLGAGGLEELLVTVIHEGCIGETVAAIEAREALEHVRDPAVRAVLETIARDEAQHAELAWRTVAWALESGGADARACIERTFAEVAEEAHRTAPSGRSRGALLAHGIVDAELRAELRAAAIAQAVLPCAEALLARRSVSSAQPEISRASLAV